MRDDGLVSGEQVADSGGKSSPVSCATLAGSGCGTALRRTDAFACYTANARSVTTIEAHLSVCKTLVSRAIRWCFFAPPSITRHALALFDAASQRNVSTQLER